MLRLNNVPEEDMPEVVRIASELYERDREQTAQDQARQAVVDAAGEVGLPRQYLERASAELHARRVAAVQRRRKVRLAAVAAAVVALGGMLAVRLIPSGPAPPRAPYQIALNADQWYPNINPESRARITFSQDGTATLHVDRFDAPPGSSNYFVNLDSTRVPPSLSGYHTVRFSLRGRGLPNVRVYLENGPTERWRSPAIPVTGEWRQKSVPFSDFELQTRSSATAGWHVGGYRPPETIRELSFKIGTYVNDRAAHGDVQLRQPGFE